MTTTDHIETWINEDGKEEPWAPPSRRSWRDIWYQIKVVYWECKEIFWTEPEELKKSERYPYDYTWCMDGKWSANVQNPWKTYGWRWPKEHWPRDADGNPIEPWTPAELQAERELILIELERKEKEYRRNQKWYRRCWRQITNWRHTEKEKAKQMEAFTRWDYPSQMHYNNKANNNKLQ